MRRRLGWPDYFVERVKNGKSYYSYQAPWLQKPVALGTDLKAAIAGVRLVERKRAPDPVQAVISRIEKPHSTVAEHLTWFLKTYLPGRRNKKTGVSLSEGTLENYRLLLSRVLPLWGSMSVAQPDRAMVVKVVESMPPESGNRMRAYLHQFFLHAVARGLREDNPVDGTVKRDVVVQRVRLEKAAYDSIYERAQPWLKRAMDLSLLSLQRPSDLCRAELSAWDGERWHIRQSKSRGHGYGLLRLKPPAELKSAIESCVAARVRDGDDESPHLMCWQPTRKKASKDRVHWAQLSEQILSRAFAELREGIVADRETSQELKEMLAPPSGTPPSYYEIKALGARLYEEAGRPIPWIQALAGHQEAATTRIYTDRHKEKWIDVDLSLTSDP